MKPGVVLKILCCIVELIMIQTLGVYLFNLHEFPAWANSTEIFSNVHELSQYNTWSTAVENITDSMTMNLNSTILPMLQNSTLI